MIVRLPMDVELKASEDGTLLQHWTKKSGTIPPDSLEILDTCNVHTKFAHNKTGEQ